MILEAGGLRLTLDANGTAALAEAFAAAASLAKSSTLTEQAGPARPVPAQVPAPAVAKKAAPAARPTAASGGAVAAGDVVSDRAAAAMLLAGEPVKRGPRASAERAGVRKGKRPGRKPASVRAALGTAAPVDAGQKRGPRASAARAGAGSADARPAESTGVTRGRKPLVDTMAAWMEGRPGSHRVEALVEAAQAEGWTAARDVSPAIRAALGRRADLFARQPDGSFVLRANLPAGRVVRRRAGEKRRAN